MKTFIFDLDDTLIYTSYQFLIPQFKLGDYIIRKINLNHKDLEITKRILNLTKEEIKEENNKSLLQRFDNPPLLKKIIEKQEELDIQQVKELVTKGENPFGIDRFPETFVRTLDYFCNVYNLSYSVHEEDLVRSFGYETFYVQKDFMPGAEEVLNFLKKRGDELILLTKGDYNWQNKKIEVHSLKDWFKEIHIVDEKNAKILETIIGLKDKSSIYKVGNSLKSDIIPALEIGINGIYVPFETWGYEIPEEIIEKKFFTFKNLFDLIENYDFI